MTHTLSTIVAILVSFPVCAFAGGSSGGSSGGDRPGTGHHEARDDRYPHLEEHYEEYSKVRPPAGHQKTQTELDLEKQGACAEDYKTYRQAAMACPSYAIPARIFGTRIWTCDCRAGTSQNF